MYTSLLNERIVINFRCDSLQVFGKWNWLGFTVINIYVEKDVWIGGYELELGLLGFNISIRYNDDKALAKFKQYEQEIKDVVK